METLNQPQFEEAKITQAYDSMVINPNLYRFFLSDNKNGMEAYTLYSHLLFAAFNQKTNRVFANNAYIGTGLSWGTEKVKRAKSWLARNGLIEYVKDRNPDGKVFRVYIKINYCRTAPIPQPIVFEKLDPEIIKSKSPTGTKFNRLDDQALDDNKQMLEEEKQMLEDKNKTPHSHNKISSNFKELCDLWYLEFSEQIEIPTLPSRSDYQWARDLISRFPTIDKNKDVLKRCITNHFTYWKQAWFLITKETRNNPIEHQKPYWEFKNFCQYFPQILDLHKNIEKASITSGQEETNRPNNINRSKRKNVISSEMRNTVIRETTSSLGISETTSISEFILHIEQYYKPWDSATILENVIKELIRLNYENYDTLFEKLIQVRPAKYGTPDVCAIKSALELIPKQNDKSSIKTCPVCESRLKDRICRTCGYEPGDDIITHKEWWEERISTN
jgi:hypothetical protein